MTVDRGAKSPSHDRGPTYYFCTAGCQAKSAPEPERYVDATSRQAVALEHAGHKH